MILGMTGRYLPLVALATIAGCASPRTPETAAEPRVVVAERQEGGVPTTVKERPVDAEPVLTGIDVLAAEGAGPLDGLRVGLITNHTGVARDGRSTIDVLHALGGVELIALFGPEHGIRGAAQAGVAVESGRDAATGLPIFSLYDQTRAPTAAELADVDALVFDMQDVGARFYTYIWTMALAMREAARHDRLFVVLDLPNPIRGDIVQGNVQDSAHLTFLGLYPMATRHGMTVGEVARWVNERHGIGARLRVVPMRGWRRDMMWDETGLEFVPPSPNMPSPVSALHYPGTTFFEQTSLSVGRGLPTAFQHIGAPWLDHDELARRLNAMALPGVRFEPVTFPAVNPESQSHLGERVPGERRGIRFIATDVATYDPVRSALIALVEVRRMHPARLEFAQNFDAIAGTSSVRELIVAGAHAERVMADWDRQVRAFEAERAPYLLY